MTERPVFAEQFKNARRALGVTQAVAALLVGRTMQTISNWETGRTAPDPIIQKEMIDRLTPD